MIDVSKYEKVGEFKDGRLHWLEGRDINAVYLIKFKEDFYIGSAEYLYIRIKEHTKSFLKGEHVEKMQSVFDEEKEFEVYVIEKGIDNTSLLTEEAKYIKQYSPTLNTIYATKGKRINKRQETFKRILEEYPHTPMRVLVEKYGKSPSAIESLIRRHGVKKNAGAKRQDSRVRYPKAERVSSVKARQQGIIQDYPYYTNEELAKKYETTISTVKSVAEKYHLRKDCQYLHELHQEIQRKRLAAYAWRDTREMAFELGITSASLRQMARSLGIKKIRKQNRSDAT